MKIKDVADQHGVKVHVVTYMLSKMKKNPETIRELIQRRNLMLDTEESIQKIVEDFKHREKLIESAQ
jgi:hypothetical protein